jgi:hypothetical protein
MTVILRQIEEMEHTEAAVKAGPWSTRLASVCEESTHESYKQSFTRAALLFLCLLLLSQDNGHDSLKNVELGLLF